MARARNLKPSFFTDDVLAEINPLGRLLFQGLWCVADRAGRLEDRPKKIKAEILPYDACNVDKLLDELHKARFIVRYERDGQRFIQVRSFSKHQNPHVKEPASTIPAPDEHGSRTVQAPEKKSPQREIPEQAGLIPDSGFPLPDSPSRIPDSGPPLSDRAVLQSSNEVARGNENPKNGASRNTKTQEKSNGQQHWSATDAGIAATAQTLGLTRHLHEDAAAFKDRVFASVNAKLVSDAAKASRGGH